MTVFATPTSSNATPSHSVRIVTDVAELRHHQEQWEALAATALDPNVFYEFWQLVPSLEAFAAKSTSVIEIALIFANETDGPVLRGVFPLERGRGYRGLPLRVARLWKPLYCFSCTPLVDRQQAGPVIEAFLLWLRRPEAACELLEFNDIRGDGPFAAALSDALKRLDRPSFESSRHQRALLDLHPDAPLDDTLSGKKHKHTRRLQRRLAELGDLRFERMAPDADAHVWIQDFLALEALGWKGQERSAMASNPHTRRHFETVALAAHERGRLDMQALRLGNRLIAMQCNYIGADAAYAFKSAYDEAYSAYSPGVLLELENIRVARDEMGVPWMDSCAVPNHQMLERLWSGRRAVAARVVSNGHWVNDASIRIWPHLRGFKRSVRHVPGVARGALEPLRKFTRGRWQRVIESVVVGLSATALMTLALD
jgi:CelD/BcsL family acetyltransferase involved in cellulose biosynthesis